MLITPEQTAGILGEKNDFIILAHENPDGDARGTALALAWALGNLGKRVEVFLEEIPERDRFLCGGDVPFVLNNERRDFEDPPYIVAVDTAVSVILGVKGSRFTKETHIDLAIDHHKSNRQYADLTCLDAGAAAASELLLGILKIMGAGITRRIAECLYVGISTDTGCFRFANTTAATLRAAAELAETGIDMAEINRAQFETKSRALLEMEKLAMAGLRFECGGRIASVVLPRDFYEQTGATEDETTNIASLPREIEGVVIGITVKERRRGEFKVSYRTNGDVDACEIASRFGGGGHKNAAGATLYGTAQEVLAQVTEAAKEFLPDK